MTLSWFLPYINMNQTGIHICPHPLEPPPISHFIPSLQIVTDHCVVLPVSYSKFPPIIYLTYGNIYEFQCYNLKSSHFPLPPLCPQVCSLCLCLYCCPTDRFIAIAEPTDRFIIPHSQILYICVNIRYLFFYFRLTQSVSSVTHTCLTLCDPMDCSTQGLPVHHQILDFTQIHVHRVGHAIQPSHPLSTASPPALIPFQHQSLFQ